MLSKIIYTDHHNYNWKLPIIIFITWFIQLCLCDSYMKTKPTYLQACQFSDPEFIKCSTKTVQQLIERAVVGIEGLDLPSLDPMKINKIRIFQGTGPVSINSSLSKVTVTGFANTKVRESKVSPKNFNWETRFVLPKMRLDGFYDVKGRILIIPLNGHGKLWIEASNMEVVMYTKTILYEKHCHVFYNVTEAKIDYNITGLKLKLDNLFDGLKSLEDGTNQYLNNNWRPAADALKPVITKTIEDILIGMLQKVFHFLPADYIVTDIPKPSDVYKNEN